MENITINLSQYLKLGGLLKNINWEKSFCDYGDKNLNAKIISFEDKGETNNANEKLIHFTFDNGNTHRYCVNWIKVNVDFDLKEIYKK